MGANPNSMPGSESDGESENMKQYLTFGQIKHVSFVRIFLRFWELPLFFRIFLTTYFTGRWLLGERNFKGAGAPA